MKIEEYSLIEAKCAEYFEDKEGEPQKIIANIMLSLLEARRADNYKKFVDSIVNAYIYCFIGYEFLKYFGQADVKEHLKGFKDLLCKEKGFDYLADYEIYEKIADKIGYKNVD